jgi:CubicO group peptidase (beta-lactamase class C family)
LAWQPGSRTGYHAATYGWLVGELVRRTDGRTLGTFFREEVAQQLGVKTAIGIDAAAFRELAVAHLDGVTTASAGAGGRVLLGGCNKRARDRTTYLGQALLSDGTTTLVERAADLIREPDWLRAEVPSSNGVTSAHDLARVFAVLALGGELQGTRLLSERTLALFSTPETAAADVVVLSGLSPHLRLMAGRRIRMPKTLGWTYNTPRKGWGPMGPSPRAVGAGGLGGQFAVADPDNQLSVAFVRSEYSHDSRAQEQLLKAVYGSMGVRR